MACLRRGSKNPVRMCDGGGGMGMGGGGGGGGGEKE